jgi:CHASE3 domain sensor protein
MMQNEERENVDVWAAVAIGAVVGIGAALIMRARQEDETSELVKRLRPLRKQAGRAAKSVRKSVARGLRTDLGPAEELVSAGREFLDDLRKGAADIVRSTRDELEKVARESVHDAQKAARRATRRIAR